MTDPHAHGATTRIQYVADGSQIRFTFPFPIDAASEISVHAGDLPASGYAVDGIGHPQGGEVVFALPPAAGTRLTLLRRSPFERAGDFRDGGPLRAAALNAEFDRLMRLAEEGRTAQGLALHAPATDPTQDLALPRAAERALRVMGFDSAGRPLALAFAELPLGGEIGGHLVTPQGASTARPLAEHLAAVVDVRDHGAKGDGSSDDTAAFEAALAAAAARAAVVHVPASPAAYVLGAPLILDGQTLIGDGPGSVLKLAHGGPAGITLTGDGPRLAALRIQGPGANLWPGGAQEVDLLGITIDGVRIDDLADDALVARVEIAACATGLAVAGRTRGVVDSSFVFNRIGVEVRGGASGGLAVGRARIRACSTGILVRGAAGLDHLALQAGRIAASGTGIRLEAPAAGWRTADLHDLVLAANSALDLEAFARNALGLRGARLGSGGRTRRTALALTAGGATTEAPTLMAELNRADPTMVREVLFSGSDLHLVEPGDMVVLATDADDVDDHWTALKATRAGIVHRILSQSASQLHVELADLAARPTFQTADAVRFVGRAASASIDSIGGQAPTSHYTWLEAEDHCRITAIGNAMPAAQMALAGNQGELHLLPASGGDRARIGGVELHKGGVNGARTALVSFNLAEDTAASFVPPGPIGMVQAFAHGALGDPASALLTYRADALGYMRLVGAAHAASVEVAQLTQLGGTTGTAGKVTFSTHSDGRIHVENRLSGPPRTVSLHVIAAAL